MRNSLLRLVKMSDEWEYSFTWRIENYSSLCLETGEELKSPFFEVKSLIGCKWFLSIFPKGENERFKEYVSCFLNRCSDNDEGFTLDFEIRVMNTVCDNLAARNLRSKKFIGKYDEWGLNNMIKIDRLEEEMKKCREDTLIVHCSIKNTMKEKQLHETGEVRTRIMVEKYSFEWIITVFPHSQWTNRKKFFCLENTLYKLSLSISKEDLEINVSRVTSDIFPARPIFGKMALLDVKEKEAVSKTETHTFDSSNDKDTWEFPSLITEKQLFDKKLEYVKNEKMVLLCEFSVLQKIEFSEVIITNSETSADIDSLISFRDDFQKLFIEKTNTDVILQVGSNVEVQAHRSVLVARSPVFSAMFGRDMLENRTGIINIEDVDAYSLMTFVEFLYTGVVNFKEWKSASTLMMVANKYQVPSLEEKCSLYLVSACSVENVCEVLLLADILGHEMLKEALLNFASNHATEIFVLPDFTNWTTENPKLSAELIAYLGKIVKEHK